MFKIKTKLLNLLLAAIPKRTAFLLQKISHRSLGIGWDPGIASEIKVISKLLRLSKTSEISVIDAGANVGDWTSAMISTINNAHVIAFEPSKATFSLLEARFRTINQVETVNLALGQTIGNKILYSDKSSSGMASMAKRDLGHLGIDFNQSEEISVITLESWLVEHPSFRLDVLKIDVEGFEYEVLIGLSSEILKVKLIQFEFGGTSIDSRRFFKDYWDFFEALQFTLWRSSPGGLLRINRYSEDLEQFTYSNYFAVNQRVLNV